MRRNYARLAGDLMPAAMVSGVLPGAFLVARTNALNADAAEYSEEAVRAMVDPWSVDAFNRRAAPEALRQESPRFMSDLFAWYANVGRLRALGPPSGRVGTGAYPGTFIRDTWAVYSMPAEFDTGPAVIALILKRVDASWQIVDFRITGEASRRMLAPPGHAGEAVGKRGASP